MIHKSVRRYESSQEDKLAESCLLCGESSEVFVSFCKKALLSDKPNKRAFYFQSTDRAAAYFVANAVDHSAVYIMLNVHLLLRQCHQSHNIYFIVSAIIHTTSCFFLNVVDHTTLISFFLS